MGLLNPVSVNTEDKMPSAVSAASDLAATRAVSLTAHILQLGWNSVAIFSVDENKKLKLDSITDFVENDKFKTLAADLQRKRYEEAVTNAISSCTVLVVQCDNKILFGHLDADKLKDAEQYIAKEFQASGDCRGVLSKIVKAGANTESYADELHFENFIKTKYKNIYVLNRPFGWNDKGISFYGGHNYFGVYLNKNDEVAVFGDYAFYEVNSNTKKQAFSDLAQLKTAAEKINGR